MMKLLKTIFSFVFLIFVFHSFAQDGFLIITPDEYEDELEVLVNYKQSTGRFVHLVNLTTINNAYSGVDLPEKIKKCIADYELYSNVIYVMLVGDSDKFPVRYCLAHNTGWGNKYYPSDLYYADLYNSSYSFDDWDGDNDGIIGEFDVSGGTNINLVNLDDIDMHPDISLARVPASTSDELTTYINKVIDYEMKAPGNWFYNAVLAVDGHAVPFGDTVKTNEDVLPYLTGSGFNIYKRYMDDAQWTGQTYNTRWAEISARLNNGVGFVNYYGHGNRKTWCNKYELGWYDEAKIPALTNDHMLPVLFATACYTGRFHFDREFYRDINNIEWNRLGQPQPVVNYPEPMAIQPSTYDSYGDESLAEHFLVKNSGGGIGYIGVTSVSEHGMWLSDPTSSVGLAPYFFEDFYNGNRTLGILWRNAVDKFATDLESIAQTYYAFFHLHKAQLYGDPSLTVGGRFTNYLSGFVYDGWYGPWNSYTQGRITGDVTVPLGQTLNVYSGVSILFNDNRKITALDPGLANGLFLHGDAFHPVCFFSLSPEPQADKFLHGMKVFGEVKVRNGGEIKLY